RYLSGCSTTGQCPEGALYVLDALLDPECDPERYVGHLASTAVLAQAHSCAANAHFLKLMASSDQILDMVMDERRFRRTENALDEDPALAYFIFAVQHANLSAKLGLVSPVVLQIGFAARETGASLGVEPCQMKRSRHVRFLWGAVMANLEEIYDEERKRREALHGRRGGCVCAAEGCGIRAEGGATLRACSGRCPRDLKPHYCSKTCQKKDWPAHKTVCKAGS
ncbi:uncharacterized protein TRAVEDRAFT_90255, partial [Trametes versicolor FP-101664 SS1]|uniref:uncharacterized protein n=1 Tax=Trametes versicolor (strain FP-101664) TaxID=717944 RepID=UPI00046244DE